jgi:hypothetical protein
MRIIWIIVVLYFIIYALICSGISTPYFRTLCMYSLWFDIPVMSFFHLYLPHFSFRLYIACNWIVCMFPMYDQLLLNPQAISPYKYSVSSGYPCFEY